MNAPKTSQTKPKNNKASKKSKRKAGPPPLKESAANAIAHFLSTLDGEGCSELYDMVLHQVEEPLLKAVMKYTQNNQSHASAMLGLNRGTLRKKLRQHGLLSEPEKPRRKRGERSARAAARQTLSKKEATKHE